jgi:hypothetical protein
MDGGNDRLTSTFAFRNEVGFRKVRGDFTPATPTYILSYIGYILAMVVGYYHLYFQ